MTEATKNASGLVRMVRSHGSTCWEEMDSESFDIYQQDSDYECREFYTAPPATNQGTTSDKYRAELYDEVWNKARDMGYGNATEALVALDRIKSAPPAAAVVMLDQYDAGLLNDFGGGNVEWWQDYIRAELERAHDFYQSQVQAPVEQSAMVVPEGWWQIIHDTLRNYRMSTLDDGHGGGYPLIDAMTADGQSVAGGIEECTYLADAIWNGLLAAAPTPEQPAKEQGHE